MKADSVSCTCVCSGAAVLWWKLFSLFQRFWHGFSCKVLTTALSAVEHLSVMLLLQTDEPGFSWKRVTTTAGIAGCNRFQAYTGWQYPDCIKGKRLLLKSFGVFFIDNRLSSLDHFAEKPIPRNLKSKATSDPDKQIQGELLCFPEDLVRYYRKSGFCSFLVKCTLQVIF